MFARISVAIVSLVAATILPLTTASGQQCSGLCQGSLTPLQNTVSRPNVSSGWTAIYTLKNTGTSFTNYSIFVNDTTGPVNTITVTPNFVQLASGATATVTVTYNVTTLGTGTLQVNASWGSGFTWADLTVNVVPAMAYHPTLSNAADGIVYTHATPSVGSMGTSRAVALQYNSTAARPVAIVALDAEASGAPISYEMRVQSNGANLHLMNGSDSVFYTASAGVLNRITAAIDAKANGLATGSYPVNIILSTAYSGSVVQTTVASRIQINDQTGSSFGAGVGLLGVGRLTSMAGAFGRLLVDGGGAMEYFDRACAGCAFASPAGESGTLVAYDSVTTDTMFRLTALDGSLTDFNRQGRMIRHYVLASIQDLTLTWSDTLLTGIVDGSGRGFTLTYSGGVLTAITDFAGRVLRTTIASGRLVQVFDPDSGRDSLTYNASNLLTQLNDRSGGTSNFGYNALDQGDTTLGPAGVDYTGANVRPRSTVVTDAQVAWQPSLPGTPTSRKGSIRPDTVYATQADPLGNVMKVQFDIFGLPTRTIDALGETSLAARDALGNTIWTHAPTGHATTATYNGYLPATTHDSTTGQTLTFTYDGSHRLEAVQGSLRYDYFYHDGTKGPAGALKLEYAGNTSPPGSGPTGGVVVDSFFPNAYGQDTLVVDGLRHRTRWTYAAAGSGGNLLQTVDANGHTTGFHYNSYGLPDTTTLVTGAKQVATYDVLGRTSAVTNGLGYRTSYVYGALGLSRISDPKGQVYKFGFNAWGLVSAQYDLGDTTKVDSLKYDVGGNLRTVVTRRNDTITLTYDALGRLLTRVSSDTAFPAESLSYGLLPSGGAWTVATNRNGRDSLAYDRDGHLMYAMQLFSGDTTHYAMSYTYDAVGRLSSRTAPPHGTTSHLAYDPTFGAVDSLCALGTCEVIKADSELKPIKLTYGAGAWSHAILYDSLHQVTADTFSLAQLQTDYQTYWGYDSLGHVTTGNANKNPGQPRVAYGYDRSGQLSNACKGIDPFCSNEYQGQNGLQAYQYDSAGNRADTVARPTVSAGNRVTRFKNYAISYDANGDVTQVAGLGTSGGWTSTDTTTLQWNAAGQLTRAEYWPAGGAHTLVTFRYDALGRRVGKSVNGVTTWFVYDGDQVEMDLDSATRTMKAEYAFNGALQGMRTPTDTLVAISAPPIGTLLGLVRARDGAERKTYGVLARTPWSEATTDTGLVVRYRMGSQEFDQETGLYHMGARYYDPTFGRWLSEDPNGIAGGLNLYEYAGNDPVNRLDPMGTDPDCDLTKANTPACQIGGIPVTAPANEGAYNPYVDCGSFGWISFNECQAIIEMGINPFGSTPYGSQPFPSGGGPGSQSLGEKGPSCGKALASVGASLAIDVVGGSLLEAAKDIAYGGRLARTATSELSAASQLSSAGARTAARNVGRLGVTLSHTADSRLAVGYGRLALATGDDAITATEDKPWLLKILESAPFGIGTGVKLGEALDTCLPSVFGAN